MVSLPHVHRDDVVEYRLFPSIPEDVKNEKQIAQALEECLDLYLAHLSPFLVDYIWQSQPFSLQLVGPDTNNNLPSHLFGVTHFGDNIEDEWFIVFLLHQVTSAFPGLVACIQDSDGNFLLIEAAYHLPRWLKPETSSNRVFINNGEVHIIPTPSNPAELVTLPAGVPSVQQALDLIRGNDVVTLADEAIRKDIQKRISQFPDKIREDWHYTHCYIPARLGLVLRNKPPLIAQAVQTFYLRDPIDLKACRVMKHFPPDDMVMVQVKFTRCLYAQLSQQKFHPDQRSGWKIPAQSNPKHKACDLGMKLAHGFEILCSRCQSSDAAGLNGEDVVDCTSGVRWQRYLVSLTEKGYFRGELEGSKLYNKLLDSAKKFYQETTSTTSGEHSSNTGHQVLDILNSEPCNIDAWKEAERNLPPSQDDSWLYLTPEQLDKMLEKAAGNPSKSNPTSTKSGNTTEESMNLESVTTGIKTFVDKVSSYQGAEFPKGPGEASTATEVNFDASAFEEALENILSYRRAGPEDDSDDSEDDDEEDFDTDDDDDSESLKEDQQMLALMEQMDKELAGTEMGKSFEKEPTTSEDTQDNQSSQYSTTGGNGSNHSEGGEDNGSDHSEGGEDRPVEVDVNLLKNIMESYSSQQGLAGPASNILHSLGVHLPQDEDKVV